MLLWPPIRAAAATSGLMRSVKRDGEKLNSAHSVLWMEAGYLSADEASDLHQRIDRRHRGRREISGRCMMYHARPTDRRKSSSSSTAGARPHTPSRATCPRKYNSPDTVSLFRKRKEDALSASRRSFIIAWDWNTLWLKVPAGRPPERRVGMLRRLPQLRRIHRRLRRPGAQARVPDRDRRLIRLHGRERDAEIREQAPPADALHPFGLLRGIICCA